MTPLPLAIGVVVAVLVSIALRPSRGWALASLMVGALLLGLPPVVAVPGAAGVWAAGLGVLRVRR